MTTKPQPLREKNSLTEALIAFSLATSAAIIIKIPSLFGFDLDQNESFYIKNMSFFILPLLTVYLAWKRKLESHTNMLLASVFMVALIFTNIYPFEQSADTETLLALHMPIALWLVVGIAFTGGKWNQGSKRMDFIRFSGEMFIYYILIALGGVLLTGFMALIFGTIDIDIEPIIESWLIPSGPAGAIIIAAWFSEIRNDLAENFAPVLAKLFSPFFAIMIITFLTILSFSGRELITDRDVLIVFDLLLIIVLAMHLYSISARSPESSPGIFDIIQIVMIISALVADGVALWGISERIVEFGFTPNRVAALGLNLILLVNLTWSVITYSRYLKGETTFLKLEKWQTDYLNVYAIWASIVVIVFPLIFGFQ